MRRIITALAALVLSAAVCHGSARTSEDFNFGWRFQLGDDAAWSAPGFDDSAWRELHLPHDWSIEGEFSEINPSGANCGALPGGIGWYRKHFTTPEGGYVAVEFDGVYQCSTVYVNGKEVGFRPFGYSSFCYDLTGLLNPVGKDNVIAVRCDNSEQPNARWYTGSGIYRDVRLVSAGRSHIAYNGVYVTTKGDDVLVSAELEGSGKLSYRILDASGKCVASGDSGSMTVSGAHRWDVDDPYMYTAEVTVTDGGKVSDVYVQPFGFREFRWDADKGFFLNGRQLKVLGVCMHHDMGCIGSAVHVRALERQLEIMKEMGCNAIRTSHNPPAPQLLDLCDRMGFLVMDEAFDTWRGHKARFDYATYFEEWHEKDLSDMVKRDRNHPSVFMWSIGNEIGEQNARTPEQGEVNRELTRHLAGIVKKFDVTRPVTAGTHSLRRDNHLIESGGLDVIGLNYRVPGYDSLEIWHPDVPMIASETVSALNSRGIYFQPSTVLRTLPSYRSPFSPQQAPEDPVPYQCTAYDNCHSFWSVCTTHQDGWIPVRNKERVAGTFVWTGFDYLGEPTAFGWPARSSYFGICDLAGFPKDPYYMYQSEWTDKTMLHVLPHWNWNEGDKIDIWAYYNNADEVELFVNGKSFGRSAGTPERIHAFWAEVPYEPGKIEVVSYRNGKEVARDVRETTGTPVKLRLTADRKTIKADGYDLSFITVEALDSKGRAVPTADLDLKFAVTGKGELFGVDNGDAASLLCLKGDEMKMFSGKALAVIRSTKGNKGKAKLTVTSSVGSAKIKVSVK